MVTAILPFEFVAGNDWQRSLFVLIIVMVLVVALFHPLVLVLNFSRIVKYRTLNMQTTLLILMSLFRKHAAKDSIGPISVVIKSAEANKQRVSFGSFVGSFRQI